MGQMASAELETKKEVLNHVSVIRVGARQAELLPQLAKIYHETWRAEGLCSSEADAIEKMAAFNPEDTFVVIDDETGEAYALIQTLPVTTPLLVNIPTEYPTYRSVENKCKAHAEATNPNFVICFSINVLPGYRVQVSPDTDWSLARFLIDGLPVPPNANRVAYSRFSHYDGPTPLDFYLDHLADPRSLGPVGMHENIAGPKKSGITFAIIEEARPEDVNGGRANVLVVYPKNDAERDAFEAARTRRLLHPPLTRTQGNNIITFADVPL